MTDRNLTEEEIEYMSQWSQASPESILRSAQGAGVVSGQALQQGVKHIVEENNNKMINELVQRLSPEEWAFLARQLQIEDLDILGQALKEQQLITEVKL